MLFGVVCALVNRQWKQFNRGSAKVFWWSAQGCQRVRHWSDRAHLDSGR